MAVTDIVACGMPSTVNCEVPGGWTAERLHEAAETTDEAVYGVDVMAARGAFRSPSRDECEVRDAFVFRDPFTGRMTVRAEHCTPRHYRQQRARDCRLASIRNGARKRDVRCGPLPRGSSFPRLASRPAALSRMRHDACNPASADAVVQLGLRDRARAGPIPASLCGSRAGGPRRPLRCRQVRPRTPVAGC